MDDAYPSGPSVKICGLTTAEDARMAERSGADYLGFVLSPGFGRSVPEDRAAAMVEGTRVARVAVLVDEPVERAVSLAGSIGASVVQLHGSETPESAAAVRAGGNWRVWKAVRARSVEDVVGAVLDFGTVIDGLLLEGWRDGVTGGGGVRLELDPDHVRAAVPEGVLFVLAGGLRPETVAAAARSYRPDVVDVSSGVEREPGRKDEATVRRFVRAAKGVRASEPEAE